MLLFLFLLLKSFSFAQGRVVINEYMPWSGCSTTSEFIELLNFGPGPVNIGCYIVTNGQYAVTIPANTLLLPGQFYVLSGQDILAAGCGNIDSAVHVQLNWTTCNCTDKAIPTTGDGFLQDGGSANEKVVLLDANLNVIDAVSRNATPSSSISITTPALSGGCSSKTFNLDAMGITYEALGMSTGKSNSFSRRVDGDCEWIKTPQQSANATNNKSGNTASVTYSLTVTKANDCNNTGGSISISVSGSNVSSFFPMSYTLAYDKDNSNTFDLTDDYFYGSDNTPPTIDVANLQAGKYRIIVSSVLGCNLKSFDFTILPCYSSLPVKLISFKYLNTAERGFECVLGDVQDMESLILEESADGSAFTAVTAVKNTSQSSGSKTFILKALSASGNFFRLRIADKDGSTFFSPILNINKNPTFAVNRLWPNPAGETIHIELGADIFQNALFRIYDLSNTAVKKGTLVIKPGTNFFSLSISTLPPGIYQFVIALPAGKQPICFRFVKQ